MKNLLRRGIIRTINRFKIDENNRLFDVVSPFVRFITFIFFYLFFLYIYLCRANIFIENPKFVIRHNRDRRNVFEKNSPKKQSRFQDLAPPEHASSYFFFFLFFFTPEQIPAFFFYSLTKYVFFFFLFRDAHFPLYFSRGR